MRVYLTGIKLLYLMPVNKYNLILYFRTNVYKHYNMKRIMRLHDEIKKLK